MRKNQVGIKLGVIHGVITGFILMFVMVWAIERFGLGPENNFKVLGFYILYVVSLILVASEDLRETFKDPVSFTFALIALVAFSASIIGTQFMGILSPPGQIMLYLTIFSVAISAVVSEKIYSKGGISRIEFRVAFVVISSLLVSSTFLWVKMADHTDERMFDRQVISEAELIGNKLILPLHDGGSFNLSYFKAFYSTMIEGENDEVTYGPLAFTPVSKTPEGDSLAFNLAYWIGDYDVKRVRLVIDHIDDSMDVERMLLP